MILISRVTSQILNLKIILGEKTRSYWSANPSWNGILGITDQGVTSAGNFFITIIIGRICSKEQLGIYMLGASVLFFRYRGPKLFNFIALHFY